MCNFFSFVVDKQGKPHYFEAKQQIKGGMDPHSHSTITNFYGIDDDSVWKYEADPRTYAVKYDGGLPETDMKSSVEKRLDKFVTGKMIKVIEEWKQEQVVLQKEIDAIVDEVKAIEWFSKKGKPLKKWKLHKNSAAAGDAAWAAAKAAAGAAAKDAARAAARAAAWDAAWDAARAAAKAAAGDAAWDAAKDAAWAAAKDAAWAAAWAAVGAAAKAAAWAAASAAAKDAAWDAEARIINLKGKHRKHFEDRMEVWRRGYGLLCDVNGILYVYETI